MLSLQLLREVLLVVRGVIETNAGPPAVGIGDLLEFGVPVGKTLELILVAHLALPIAHGGEIETLSVMFLVTGGALEVSAS